LGGAGGFSGARFWRIETDAGQLALRRWPQHYPTPERLTLIHALLAHVDQQGFRRVPVPLETSSGATFFEIGGHLWELSPWLAGEAVEIRWPDVERLRAALVMLAEFHLAAESFPACGAAQGPSPGIAARQRQLQDLTREGVERLAAAVRTECWAEGAPVARRILTLFPLAGRAVADELRAAARLTTPLQLCLRDVWSDHILFEGKRAGGLIDFGAVRVESPAADVARLLGSMAGDNPQAWTQGLHSYQTVRRLSDDERQLVRAFDRSTVLLAGINWIEWIYCDQRPFENLPKIARRLEHFADRLAHLVP
jgi:homoserine kinase type II